MRGHWPVTKLYMVIGKGSKAMKSAKARWENQMVVTARGIRKTIIQSTSPLATTPTAKDTDSTAMVSWWRPWILSGWHSVSEVGVILLEDEGPHVRATFHCFSEPQSPLRDPSIHFSDSIHFLKNIFLNLFRLCQVLTVACGI